jgi:hypothetical protein
VTVALHGDRHGDRPAGKPITAAMASPTDPATAVVLARRLLQSGAWRTVPKQGDDTDKALYLLHARVPAALAVLGRVAVAAMTKRPPSPGCHWCAAHLLAVLSFAGGQEDAYPARDELTLAFLGQPCARCQARHARDDQALAAMAEAAKRERRIDADVAAAGGPLAWFEAQLPAGRCPSCQQVHPQRPAAGRLPAATGMMWAAGDGPPPAITAALRSLPAAGRRRRLPDRFARDRGDVVAAVPDPPYYRPRGRGGLAGEVADGD